MLYLHVELEDHHLGFNYAANIFRNLSMHVFSIDSFISSIGGDPKGYLFMACLAFIVFPDEMIMLLPLSQLIIKYCKKTAKNNE